MHPAIDFARNSRSGKRGSNAFWPILWSRKSCYEWPLFDRTATPALTGWVDRNCAGDRQADGIHDRNNLRDPIRDLGEASVCRNGTRAGAVPTLTFPVTESLAGWMTASEFFARVTYPSFPFGDVAMPTG